ncbi:hypothetical protein LguiB_029988 [Lonicera macranthoides]
MDEIETLGFIDEIQALVSDKLQVVSYKWLSRNFLLPSNAAKRLLQEFVEKHGNGLEVVYTLSGWLKNNPSVYHVRLISRPNLQDAKGDFNESCSVQVYSVQACIPKDPAALWNAEFIQAEELFKQPPTVDNCLRDNRFCGVSSSFVKRNTDGTPVSTSTPQAKTEGVPGPSSRNSAQETATIPKPQQRKIQQSSPNVGGQSSSVAKDVKSGAQEQDGKSTADKENVPQLPANKKKGQDDKSSTRSGGSLASMWGRASAKPKPSFVPAETKSSVPNSAVSAEAQICAREAVEDGSSDDDDDCRDVNFKRSSNCEGSRKRRVVFDYSDEEEDEYKDAVSLSSPDPPKLQSSLDSKQFSKSFLDSKKASETPVLEKNKLDFDEEKEVKTEKATNSESNQLSLVLSNGKNAVVSSSDKIHCRIPENNASMKDKVANAAPNSPKRRKVLKTRIDERGREVTEVVWEGEEAETKATGNATKKADSNPVKSTDNRPPVVQKSPTAGGTAVSNPSGKGGNKKAGNKDPKQGNILSFFKKV